MYLDAILNKFTVGESSMRLSLEEDDEHFQKNARTARDREYTEQDAKRLSNDRAPLGKRCNIERMLVCRGGAFDGCW